MLKYRLKKGIVVSPGSAIRYKSREQLKAILNALDISNGFMPISNLSERGFFILSCDKKDIGDFYFSKYLTRSNEIVVKKKDIFEKIKYEDSGKYANQSNIKESSKIPTHYDHVDMTLVNKATKFNNDIDKLKQEARNILNGSDNRTENTKVSGPQGFFDMMHKQENYVDMLKKAGDRRDELLKIVGNKFSIFCFIGAFNLCSENENLRYGLGDNLGYFNVYFKNNEIDHTALVIGDVSIMKVQDCIYKMINHIIKI